MKNIKEYLLTESKESYYIVPLCKIDGHESIEEWIGPYSDKDEAYDDIDTVKDTLENENITIIYISVLNDKGTLEQLKKYNGDHYSLEEIERFAHSKYK